MYFGLTRPSDTRASPGAGYQPETLPGPLPRVYLVAGRQEQFFLDNASRWEDALERASAAAENLPAELVYVGFSIGARPAQMLTQTRPGAKGAVLFHGYHSIGECPVAWPDHVPLQVHRMESDEWCDAATADKLACQVPDSELFTYAGSAHLFTDASPTEYEPQLARLAISRAVDLLDRIDRAAATE